MTNPKIYENITSQMECVNLLEILGFKEMADVVSDSGLQHMMIISQNDILDQFQTLQKVHDIITEIQKQQNVKSLTNYFDLANGITPLPGTKKP